MSYPADYIVVVSNDDDHFSGYHHFAEKINRKLKAGYQLHGQPFPMERTMCQAMFRPANAEAGQSHQFVEAAGDTTTFYQRAVHA